MTLAPLVSPVRLRCECCEASFLGYESDLCPDCANDPAALAELAKRKPTQAELARRKAKQAAQKKAWCEENREYLREYNKKYNDRRRSALAAKKGL